MILVDAYSVLKGKAETRNSTNEELWPNFIVTAEMGAGTLSSITTVRLKRGASSKLLYHKKTTKYIVVVDGSPHIKIDDLKPTLLHTKSVVIVCPPQEHRIWNMYNNDVLLSVISFPAWDPDDEFYP